MKSSELNPRLSYSSPLLLTAPGISWFIAELHFTLVLSSEIRCFIKIDRIKNHELNLFKSLCNLKELGTWDLILQE